MQIVCLNPEPVTWGETHDKTEDQIERQDVDLEFVANYIRATGYMAWCRRSSPTNRVRQRRWLWKKPIIEA